MLVCACVYTCVCMRVCLGGGNSEVSENASGFDCDDIEPIPIDKCLSYKLV